MKYKCIETFLLDEYDDNGAFAEKQIQCEENSIWENDEIANRFIGDKDTVRLIEISNKDNFRWMEISKEMLDKYFEIEDRVISINITDEMGTHALQVNSFIVKCKSCSKERHLFKSDMQENNIKLAKCECGGSNEFRYWLDNIYTEEEYEELERQATKKK